MNYIMPRRSCFAVLLLVFRRSCGRKPAGRIRSEEGILSFSMSIISHLLAECNRSCVKKQENISSRPLDIVLHMW